MEASIEQMPQREPGEPAAIAVSSSSSAPQSSSSEEDVRRVTHRYRQRNNLPWFQQSTTKIKVAGLPFNIDTRGVWEMFSRFGNIDKIDLYPGTASTLPDAAIIFKPPPQENFWGNSRLTVFWRRKSWPLWLRYVPSSEVTMIGTTPSRPSYPESLELKADKLEFGILYSPTSMKAFHTASPSPHFPVLLRLHLQNGPKLEIEFPEYPQFATNTQSVRNSSRQEQYRFVIPFFAQFKLFASSESNRETETTALIISMETPPEFSRRYSVQDSHQFGATRWDGSIDPWFRVTDLSERSSPLTHPVSLQDSFARHKLGRWLTYKITFNKSTVQSQVAGQFFAALEDHNQKIYQLPSFEMIDKDIPSVFEILDCHPLADQQQSVSFSQSLQDYDKISLDFQVRYQLEVCISEGYLSEYHLDQQFLQKLKEMDPSRARGLLIGVAAQKKKIFDPLSIFDGVVIKPDRLQLPNYCFYARAVTITPTTMYVATPTLDVSNRVIRRYREHTDRFLRVRFMEERPRSRVRSTTGENMNMLYQRVKDVMMNGIVIGDRHYQFLAFGNSQLREHTAYFFCSNGHVTPEKIRAWMGNFHDKVVAKYAARLGQCFSTTRAVLGAYIRLGKIEDVRTTDQKYLFTDGVGVISEFMAKLAANELGVLSADGRSPSALQFRLGGCKGVLAVWPSQQKQNKEQADIWIRRSQEKFRAEYQGLEIIRWSHFSSAYLNRQLITILTTLGVPDKVFIDKLDNQLSELEEAMTNPAVSSRLLQRDIDPNQMSLEVAAMVNSHFQFAQEPFMLSVLQLWRAYTIKYLKEKARILIHEGANLLGVIDETGQLKGHFDTARPKKDKFYDLDALPEIFVQVSNLDGIKGENRPKVIEGVVILARNPSLHPGDIRVVRAVNNPHLHHLKDVVVLPKTGDRDLASMCSGGDLDGDDYLVIWDQSLIPREWNHEPMDFTPPPALEVAYPVTVDDITSFFVQYIKNDALGTIAHAHLAWADASEIGAKDPKCLELAALHSIAVDYPKSGRPAVMKPHLRPKVFPHFMEKKRGREYISKTALGQLYDRIQRIDYMPDYEKPFDSRILDACNADEETLEKAAIIKADYDEGVRRIMAQHGIEWELEVWSTFVLYQDGVSNSYKFHEEIGRLSSSLKDAARSKCYEQAGGREYEKIAPFVAAMYKITSLQVQEALNEIDQRPIPRGATLPFISFPWIFSSILGDIAVGRLGAQYESVAKVDTTALASIPTVDQADMENKHVKKVAHNQEVDAVVETGGETLHRGEFLELFDHSGANNDKLEKMEDLISFDTVHEKDESDNSSHNSDTASEEVLIESRSDGDLVNSSEMPLANGVERTIDGLPSLLERLAQMQSK